jgi:predicted dehydrogenase
MKSLIVGMGIGQLYKSVLTTLGHEIVTVDTNPAAGADFTDLNEAIRKHSFFHTAHICTPNYTHLPLAEKIASYSNLVFIEKPGFSTSNEWNDFIKKRPFTRVMMVKNNMWRNNIAELADSASKAKNVDIEWIRRNCIPSPGSWFTTRDLAFGGVSRDLMPHLLSLYIAMNPNWRTEKLNGQASLQNWLLEDIDSTEYGTVYPNGTHDVDDQCYIGFGSKWTCRANWRSLNDERSAITFTHQDNSKEVFELGWCPEEAYLNMIKDAITNLNNTKYWENQAEIDLWIHERIENL